MLLTYDITIRNNALVNVLTDDRLGELLAAIPAREILVFIDACHSGSATRSTDGNKMAEQPKTFYHPDLPVKSHVRGGDIVKEIDASQRHRYICLSACKDTELSLATDSGSLFTRGLVHAVRQSSANRMPITMEQLRKESERYNQNHISNAANMYHPQLYGNAALKTKDLTPEPVPEPIPETSELWRKLEYLASKAQYNVPITLNQMRQKVNDNLVITCEPPQDGYINVLEVGSRDTEITVLYPNRYHPENKVRANTRITIPADDDKFELRAVKPDKNLIVVLITDKPLNAYKDGDGDPKKPV